MPASLSHEQARQHEVSGDSPGPRHFRKDRGTSYLKGFENPSGKGKRHLLLPVVDGVKGINECCKNKLYSIRPL